MNKVEKRIAKAQNLPFQIIEATNEIDPDSRIEGMVKEDTVTDILAELLQSLKNGESLEEAIMTIHENF